MSAIDNTHPSTVVGFMSMADVARLLGKAKPRAGRDWCKGHGVPLRRDGKVTWATTVDVKAAIAGLPVAANDDDAARKALIERMVSQRTGGR